uniref:C-type lectin domain-containing protein n=1 Tax=Amphilophus citrinellus TaxID=61819 RepID=A0A3Q0SY01_AMPCI
FISLKSPFKLLCMPLDLISNRCQMNIVTGCSCYLLSERSDSWDAARKDCRDRGADLVVIDSSEEQTITNTHTWIGLNDKEQEGQWKWVDGTYWGDRQPDNDGGGEHCGHVRNDEKRSWNDLPCSASLKWICEKIP